MLSIAHHESERFPLESIKRTEWTHFRNSKFRVCAQAPPTHKHVRTKRHNIPRAAATFLALWRFFFWDHSRQTVLCRVRNRFFICVRNHRWNDALLVRTCMHHRNRRTPKRTSGFGHGKNANDAFVVHVILAAVAVYLPMFVRTRNFAWLTFLCRRLILRINHAPSHSSVCWLHAAWKSTHATTKNEKLLRRALFIMFLFRHPRSTVHIIECVSSPDHTAVLFACMWVAIAHTTITYEHGILSFHSSHTELDWLFGRSMDAGSLIRHTRTRTDTHNVVCGHFVVQWPSIEHWLNHSTASMRTKRKTTQRPNENNHKIEEKQIATQ